MSRTSPTAAAQPLLCRKMNLLEQNVSEVWLAGQETRLKRLLFLWLSPMLMGTAAPIPETSSCWESFSARTQLDKCLELTVRSLSQPGFHQGPRTSEVRTEPGHLLRRSRLSSSTPDNSCGRSLAELSDCEPSSIFPGGLQRGEPYWKGTGSGHKRGKSLRPCHKSRWGYWRSNEGISQTGREGSQLYPVPAVSPHRCQVREMWKPLTSFWEVENERLRGVRLG